MVSTLTSILERSADNYVDVALESICRITCTLLGVPAAVILVARSSRQWSHVCDASYREAASFASFENASRGILSPLRCDGQQNPMGIECDFSGAPTGEAAKVVAKVEFGTPALGVLIAIDRIGHNLSQNILARLDDLGIVVERLISHSRTEKTLVEQRSFYQMLAEASTDTIVRGDIYGTRLYVSPSIHDLLGYAPDELIGRKAQDLTHPDDLSAFAEMMRNLQDQRSEVLTQELRQRHKNGTWIWMEASLRLTRDSITQAVDGYVVSVRSIDTRKELEARLEKLASCDELTDLPNRMAFRKELNKLLANGESISVLYMDLDGFKKVNDLHGHRTGDALLRDFADRLRSQMGIRSMVARIGGDEFTAIVPFDRQEIALLCERLVAVTALPFTFDGLEIRVGISIGVAISETSDRNIDALLHRADWALYSAKHAGKGTFRFAPDSAALPSR